MISLPELSNRKVGAFYIVRYFANLPLRLPGIFQHVTEVITSFLNSMVQFSSNRGFGGAEMNRAVAPTLRLWGVETGQDIADYALMLAIILVFLLSTIRCLR